MKQFCNNRSPAPENGFGVPSNRTKMADPVRGSWSACLRRNSPDNGISAGRKARRGQKGGGRRGRDPSPARASHREGPRRVATTRPLLASQTENKKRSRATETGLTAPHSSRHPARDRVSEGSAAATAKSPLCPRSPSHPHLTERGRESELSPSAKPDF